MQHRPSTLAARLRNRVKKGEGCWIWTGSCDGKGYGRIAERQRPLLTHRVAYELHYGTIPNGLFVLHSCDNPPCCRPSHLFLGTNDDNMKDCARKNRTTFGERSPTAKLTDDQVAAIRASCDFLTMREMVDRYGVSGATLRSILRNRTWRRTPGPPLVKRKSAKATRASGELANNVKLTEADVALVRLLYANGSVSQRALGDRFEVSHATIWAVLRGRTWKDRRTAQASDAHDQGDSHREAPHQ